MVLRCSVLSLFCALYSDSDFCFICISPLACGFILQKHSSWHFLGRLIMIWETYSRENRCRVGIGVCSFIFLSRNYGKWQDNHSSHRRGQRWFSENATSAWVIFWNLSVTWLFAYIHIYFSLLVVNGIVPLQHTPQLLKVYVGWESWNSWYLLSIILFQLKLIFPSVLHTF